MNNFQEKSALKIIKNFAKAVCIFVAAFTLAVFGGCDLFGLSTPDEKGAEVTISQSSAVISVGATVTLTAVSSEKRAISWVSSDEEVATVDGGTVTGVGVGETSITASDGKKTAVCEVTVTEDNGRKLVWSDEFKGNSLDTAKGGIRRARKTVTAIRGARNIGATASCNIIRTAITLTFPTAF